MISVGSRQASHSFPGLPAMNTVAPGYEAGLWLGMAVAAGTPPALIQRYNRELVEIAGGKELAEQMHTDGATPVSWTPKQFGARMRSEFAIFKKLASERNIVME